MPFTHSVTSDEEAMAEPQPKDLNFASSTTPSSFTLSCRVRERARVVRDLRLRLGQALVVHPELQLHHVAAGRRAHETRADVRIVLVERADVARVLVVVDDLVAVCHVRSLSLSREAVSEPPTRSISGRCL